MYFAANKIDLLALALLFMLVIHPLVLGAPAYLRCHDMINPAGIDDPHPHLSWILDQDNPNLKKRGAFPTAFQIIASSTADAINNDKGELWDSGRISMNQLSPVSYAGKPLASGQKVFWKVRSWDENGVSSEYSSAATWTMGILSMADWHSAHWIGSEDTKADSILIRRTINVRNDLTRAIIFVTGLGQYELSINGLKIGDQLLAPGWTDYRKTVLYDTHDITNLIKPGQKNAIGMILGGGMYSIKPSNGRYVKFKNSFGPLKAIINLQLEYADGSKEFVVSDRTWQCLSSPITFSNIFGGEDYDSRKIQSNWDQPDFLTDSATKNAVEMDGPGGSLRGCSVAASPIQAIQNIQPISSRTLKPSVIVFDLGQNASIMPKIVVKGQAGSSVRIIPSELLGSNGYVDRTSAVQDAGGPAWWQYTLNGSGSETYFPKFFYQGGRYLQVELFPGKQNNQLPQIDSIEGIVIHSAAEVTGKFETSNELFNKIYDLVRWAQRSNMMSLMTDCPHREKLGWLEELHLNGPSLRYNFRLNNLYTKQMNDMADAQLEVGLIPNIAPEYFLAHTDKLDDAFRNSPEWGSSFIIAAWQQYEFTGDISLLEKHYQQMVRYHHFLGSASKDDIINVGLGDWYDIGPKPPWGSQLTPPAFTATAIYFYDTLLLSKIAGLLNIPDEASAYNAQAARIRSSFNRRFFDPEKGKYATGSQCTSAMPLALGIVEEKYRVAVLQTLINDIRSRGNALSAGDVGYRFVLRALADAGRSDVIFEMNNQSDRPGYGMQIARGATSLTEKWDASVGSFGSQNHFMLGQINEWFFHDLAGIQSDPAAPGFKNVIIKPALVGDLSYVRASYFSVRGQITSNWTNNPSGLTLSIVIPEGSSGTIYVPASTIEMVQESGQLATKSPGVKFIRMESGAAIFAVASGFYEFSSTALPSTCTKLNATSGNSFINLQWTGVANASHYSLRRRELPNGETHLLSDYLDATTFADNSVKNGCRYRYTISACNRYGVGKASEIDVTPGLISNYGFEFPIVNGDQYAPSGGKWNFTQHNGLNGSGIATNWAEFTNKNENAPEGYQVAFLQGESVISQQLLGLTPGKQYLLRFKASQRATYNTTGQTWHIEVDGKIIEQFDIAQSETRFKDYQAIFPATSEGHLISFIGTNRRGGDNTVLIDEVQLEMSD